MLAAAVGAYVHLFTAFLQVGVQQPGHCYAGGRCGGLRTSLHSIPPVFFNLLFSFLFHVDIKKTTLLNKIKYLYLVFMCSAMENDAQT